MKRKNKNQKKKLKANATTFPPPQVDLICTAEGNCKKKGLT